MPDHDIEERVISLENCEEWFDRFVLPYHERTVIVMLRLDGLSLPRIAQQINRPYSWVFRQLCVMREGFEQIIHR